MSEPKLISPLLDGFIMGEPMSDHHGVCCCPAMRENTDERYIVKIISIPASQVQLDALLLSGAYSDPEEARAYFADLAQDVTEETEMLTKLTKLEGFLSYTGCQIVPMEDGVGYQVYLISPYKRTLEKLMCQEPLTHLAAVNLGLDMCAALAACRRAGVLYLDLKPSNIFLTENNGCCIGDLGFMPISSLKFASLPEKYRSSYTAPEITDAMSALNDTMDIYALGLTLYQVYNNGQLPFAEAAPAEVLPPPMYADYEMAEIILKACAPNPADRWQDPAQMGQALVSYMQRNDVNAVPIVPPPVEIAEEVPEEVEEFLSEDENEAALAPLLDALDEEQPPVAVPPVAPEEDLSFIEESAADETAPTEESAADVEDTVVTEEVAEILAQADELISHELPEPPVAPEPIEIPFPAPIVLESEEDTTSEAPNEETAEEPAPEEEAEAEPVQEEIEEEEEEDLIIPITSDQRYKKKESKFKPKVLIIIVILLALVAGIGAAGYYYYYNIYLQSIDALEISGTVDQMTVLVTTETDETLLTVVCTDTYGNTRKTAVTNGKAEFIGLNPSTQYKVVVEIDGFHKLTGKTAGAFVTGKETKVLTFNAKIGPEDGSVILNFTATGPTSDIWTVSYTDGKTTGQKDFTGSTVTVTGLSVGKEYHFTLSPKTELYLTGNCELDFTAQQIVVARDLTVDSCADGELHAVWTLPEGMSTASWTVRCFSDAGYDETITTDAMEATFTGLDHSSGYTVTVTAAGMNQFASTSVTANPITITAVDTQIETSGITVTWEFSGNAPEKGWVLSCSINGSAPAIYTCTNNTTVLEYYPGCSYSIEIRPQDDVTYYPMSDSFETEEAAAFKGYLITAEDIEFSMLLTPEEEDWDMWDLTEESYRTTFLVGERASFLVQLHDEYDYSKDEIVITYVIHDENNIPVSKSSVTTRWCDMWDLAYCELDLPALPTTAGTYTLDIYFNDMLAGSQQFTITEPVPPAAVE